MFRSSDVTRGVGTALLGCVLLTSGCGLSGGNQAGDEREAAAQRGAAAQAASSIPSVVPLPAGGQGARGRVLDIHAPVVDLSLTVSSIDGSIKETSTDDQRKVTLASDVLFAFDKATLSDKARSRLKETAKIIRTHAEGTVQIDGYTDSKGSRSYNLELSRRRAKAVKNALQELLSDTSVNFKTGGHGEAGPVAPNKKPNGEDNPKGRAKNRRVQITFPQ